MAEAKSNAAPTAASNVTVPPPPEADPDAPEAEGFGASDLLMDSVNKMEWKNIEAALTYQKKNVAEMLRRACSQIRVKGEMQLDDSNGKFLSDMLHEMDDFASWCYKEHIRPKLQKLPLDLPEDLLIAADPKAKKKGGGGKGGGKGGKKEEKIPAKTQIKIDNVMRIMNGEAAKSNTMKKVSSAALLRFRGRSCTSSAHASRPASRTHSRPLVAARRAACAA